MTSDVEYLLLKDKGPYLDVCVRSRVYRNSNTCRFYTTVATIITVTLLVLLVSLVYVFVLVPSHQGHVLTWDGRSLHELQQPVVANTQCGPVQGLSEGSVKVFKGIPYAVPPVGSRRWERPEALSRGKGTCWSGTKMAQHFGSQCVQPASFTNYSASSGSEDCLFLNVWTPSLDSSSRLPVMFWIHGGSLIAGNGNQVSYSPTAELARSTNAVYVSINYRLGPLGFLALSDEGADSAKIAGNFGLMDMVLALTWVRDNIANFGGNADLVTVFGQSSGGTAIHALLGSPLTSGLFHRAWLASGSAILNKTFAEAAQVNRIFLQRSGCPDIACMRQLSADQLNKITPWTVFPYWGQLSLFDMPEKGKFVGALPVVDGYVLKEAPIEAWKNGRGIDVPTLFSTMAQEVDILPFDPNISSWSWADYNNIVTSQLTPFSPNIAQEALKLYPFGTHFTPEYQYTSLVSDARETCPTNVLADVKARHFRSPVYRAVMTSWPSVPANPFGLYDARYAFHAWDTIAFFGDFAGFGFHPSEADLKFQSVLRQQLMSFARNGRPEAPVWNTAQTCTALISDHVFPVEQYNRERCEFWLRNGFFSYSWIN